VVTEIKFLAAAGQTRNFFRLTATQITTMPKKTISQRSSWFDQRFEASLARSMTAMTATVTTIRQRPRKGGQHHGQIHAAQNGLQFSGGWDGNWTQARLAGRNRFFDVGHAGGLFQNVNLPGQRLMVECPTPRALLIAIGHAPESGSLHQEEFKDKWRQLACFRGRRL
jgi:hypothetical protein